MRKFIYVRIVLKKGINTIKRLDTMTTPSSIIYKYADYIKEKKHFQCSLLIRLSKLT